MSHSICITMPHWVKHHSDVIMSVMASQITGISMVGQPFVQAQIKENIKTLHHWLLWGEFTSDPLMENVSIWWRHHANAGSVVLKETINPTKQPDDMIKALMHVTCRALSMVYAELEAFPDDEITVHVSFLEIYQEVGYDLLNMAARTNSVVTHFPKVLYLVTYGQNGCHLAVDTLKCIFLKEFYCILFQFSQNSASRCPIDNKSSLVQVLAWCRAGTKPLPEPMMTKFSVRCHMAS